MSSFFQMVYELGGIRQAFKSVYKPQTNGEMEILNRTIFWKVTKEKRKIIVELFYCVPFGDRQRRGGMEKSM